MKPCATGSRMSAPRIICSAPCSAHIPTRKWCAIFIGYRRRSAGTNSQCRKSPACRAFCLRRRRLEFHRTLHAFMNDASVKMIGVEAGGRGHGTRRTCRASCRRRRFRRRKARRASRNVHVCVAETRRSDCPTTHSISAGLDYPAVGPEHVWLTGSAPRRIHRGQ